jgi:periplasmic protein TonB
VAASLILHTLIIAAILWPATHFLTINDPGNPFLPPGGGGGGGGGGGESVAYISLPAFTPPPPAAEVVEVPPVETPEVEVVPEPMPAQDTVKADTQVVAQHTGTSPGAGNTGTSGDGGSGGGVGPGNGTGTGPGSGPGSGGGNGFAQPPSPKQMLIPPEGQPRELRNQTVRAMFSIDQNGKVERVEFDPEIRNRDYANKLREKLLAFRFTPARAPDGRAVAVQYPIDITF